MCSVIILRRPGEAWPLILGANRDEMAGRPWQPPARHWPERPEVIAGLDSLAGGSWMGLNEHGLVACILNRVGSLGPAAGKRSRGELVLEALDHATAADAAEALAHLDPAAYRTFNLLVADEEDALWLRHAGDGQAITAQPVPAGLSILTAHDLNDPASPRVREYLPRFREAAAPRPEQDAWQAWEALLGSRNLENPYAGLCVVTDSGFGTVSSSLLALPRRPQTLTEAPRRPVWRFAAGRPDQTAFVPLDLTS